MAKTVLTDRRSVVAGLTLAAAAVAGPKNAVAQATPKTPDKSLYERLGGAFAIAAVVDRFSDALIKNPIVGQQSVNPQLREWHTKSLDRLPGLKFMRTLWVCTVAGGPFKFTATRPGATPLGLEEAASQPPDHRSGIRRGRRGTGPDARRFQGSEAREGRGPGG